MVELFESEVSFYRDCAEQADTQEACEYWYDKMVNCPDYNPEIDFVTWK